MTIRLPKYVFEMNVNSFLHLLCSGNAEDRIYLDFANVKHYIPIAITSIVACIRHWQDRGKEVFLLNHRDNEAFRYLQRIDFFTALGLDYEEDFRRHAPLGDFVTITKVNRENARNVEPLIEELVGTLFPEKDFPELFRLLQYALGEIIRNCVQHSDGEGFVSAQYSRVTDLIRIGIADNGIGIRESFKGSNSPHFRENFDDRDCLELALKPEVSSKNHIKGPYGEPVNAGVGLSIVQAVVGETLGYFVLASGSAVYLKKGRNSGSFYPPFPGSGYQGTAVAVAFSRNEVYQYAEILMDAKRKIGLINDINHLGKELFQ
jgi:hypothetical protein